MLMIIGSVLLLIAAVFGLVILIGAFKESALQGILCLFVPFYMFYYAFAKYQSPKKGLVVSGWLAGIVLGVTLQVVGGMMAANEAVASFEADMQNLDLASPPAGGAEAAPAGDARVVSCNLSEQPGRICNQYSLSGSYTQENAADHCDMIQMMADEKLPLADAPCPTENAIARCEPRFGSNTTVYYRDPSPDIDNDAAMTAAETLCTGTFTRL